MCRFLSIVILFIAVVAVTADVDLNEKQINNNPVDVSREDITFSPNLRLTVETEKKINKTLTQTRGLVTEESQGRTFGIRRLQLILLPLMYKMGVMSTVLAVILAVSLKSLLIGLILLLFKMAEYFAKFHHHPSHEPAHHETHWAPPAWPQPIHLHISHDNDNHHDHDHHPQDQVYSGWDRSPYPDPYRYPVTVDQSQNYHKG